jgi:hypothetical protein
LKIKVLDRVLLFIGAFLVAMLGVRLVLLAIQTAAFEFPGIRGDQQAISKWLVILAGIVLFVYGVYVMSLPQKYRRRKEEFVVLQTASGEMRISVKAIESLVQKCVATHEEISLKSLNILSQRSGVLVDIRVVLADNVSIPLAVEALQKQVKSYLLPAAGVEAKEVRVSVETTGGRAQVSPYILAPDATPVGDEASVESSTDTSNINMPSDPGQRTVMLSDDSHHENLVEEDKNEET